ncbi:MAG: hypothetical protein H7145_23555 [Akkermansiaceae bacterium]|nr:hypothetical protein [Armatimonadota bacterium]
MNQRARLYVAMSKGDSDAVAKIVEDGVVLNYANKADLPLVYCVRNKDYKSLQLLLSHGAETDTLAASDALVLAVRKSDLIALRLLLKYGVSPLKSDRFGIIPSEQANETKNGEIIALLKIGK